MDEYSATIPACELRRGDYLDQTRCNGRAPGGSSLVERVRIDGAAVTVTVPAGAYSVDYTYPAAELVTIARF